MTAITTINSTDAFEPTSRTEINNNFAALNAGKFEQGSAIVTVGVTGQYQTIQSGMDALPSTGGVVQLLDPTITLISSLVYDTARVEIWGKHGGTIIQGDGSLVSPFIQLSPSATPQTIEQCGLRHVQFLQTNATVQGVAIDASNMAVNIYEDIYFANFGTPVKMNDTANYTYFNKFADIKIFNSTNAFDLTSTNIINDNTWFNVKVSLRAGGGGSAIILTKSQGNSFYNFTHDQALGSGSGLTGININTSTANTVLDTNFFNCWFENVGTLANIGSGSTRTNFHGGSFIWDGADTTNGVVDNGIQTNFFAVRRETGAPNTPAGASASYNKFGVFTATGDSSSGNDQWYFKNNNNFAHGTNSLIKMELLNGSDTTPLHELVHNGTGTTAATGPALKVAKGKKQYNPVTVPTFAAQADNLALIPGIYYRMDASTSSQNVTGIVAGLDGQIIHCVNWNFATGQSIVFKHASGSSTVSNRFYFSGSADVTLVVGASITLVYDLATTTWFRLN